MRGGIRRSLKLLRRTGARPTSGGDGDGAEGAAKLLPATRSLSPKLKLVSGDSDADGGSPKDTLRAPAADTDADEDEA